MKERKYPYGRQKQTPPGTGDSLAAIISSPGKNTGREDNDGFCSTDFLWEKHSRLKVLDAEKKEVAVFDFDSGQREKELSAENRLVHVLYWPSYQTRRTLTIHADDLTITNDIVEHNI